MLHSFFFLSYYRLSFFFLSLTLTLACSSKPEVQVLLPTSAQHGSQSSTLQAQFQAIESLSPNASLRIRGPLTKIAFGSCMDQNLPTPIWKALNAEAETDLFIALGDIVYASWPEVKPIHQAYLKQIQNHPELVTFRKKVPWIGIWDDHDYGINDGGGEHPEYEEAKESLLAFLPNVKKMIPEDRKRGLYYSVIIGQKPKTIQIIVLDVRSFKSPWVTHPAAHPMRRYQPAADSSLTLLGEEQWKWLEEEFLKPANVRLLVSSIQVLPTEHGFEKWANFPHERQRLLKMIEVRGIKNLFILSGDRHFAEVSRLKLNKKQSLVEFTSSGLNKESNLTQEVNPLRLPGSAFFKANYGLITVDYIKKQLRYQTKDAQGEVRFDKTFSFR
jgi:alkaline phosphatase D